MKEKIVKQINSSRRKFLHTASIGAVTAGSFYPMTNSAQVKGTSVQSNKPNIVFIWRDHIKNLIDNA